MHSNETDEERRQELLRELKGSVFDEPNRWTPGSFGCHELLDRIHILSNQFEAIVVEHPSCVLNEDWFHAACRISA